MDRIDSFEEALRQTSYGKRHLLMGNGFSIACRQDLFSYGALYDAAKDQLGQLSLGLFSALETTDFEEAMRVLDGAGKMFESLDILDNNYATQFNNELKMLRETLARVIARNHPDRIDDLEVSELMNCREFLANFDRFYTVNYDLLLYWACMHSDLDGPQPKFDDGFRTPRSGPQDWVEWQYTDAGQQNVFYLHGALHIFDAGDSIQKFTWANTGVALVDQIRDALEKFRFPVYVAEGDSGSKVKKVLHNAYLARGYRSMSEITGSLFVFGHSLADNDEHVLQCIVNNKVERLYVSIFGDPNVTHNRRIMERARALAEKRLKSTKRKNPVELDVGFLMRCRLMCGNDGQRQGTTGRKIDGEETSIHQLRLSQRL